MTARELLDYCRGRGPCAELRDISPLVLESFIWGHSSKARALVAAKWITKNLRASWPVDRIVVPDAGPKSVCCTHSAQAPYADPTTVYALADEMEKARVRRPSWLALLASWLQTFAFLRLQHVPIPADLLLVPVAHSCAERQQCAAA
eukprot:8082506-Karenia_brevis.AAC.1